MALRHGTLGNYNGPVRISIAVATGCTIVDAALAQLPPEIIVDRHFVRPERLLAGKEFGAALAEMDAIILLQGKHDLELPEDFDFKYAEVAIAEGRTGAAIDSLNDYLLAVGRSGEFYRQALELLDEAERATAVAEAAAAASAEFNGGDPTAFALFNGCGPMSFLVEVRYEELPAIEPLQNRSAAEIAPLEDDVRAIGEAQLRAEGLYTQKDPSAAGTAGSSELDVSLVVTPQWYALSLEFRKPVGDVYGRAGLAATGSWDTVSYHWERTGPLLSSSASSRTSSRNTSS